MSAVFLFSSQGGQWAGMGRDLRAAEPAFHDSIARSDASIRRLAGWSLIEELCREPDAWTVHREEHRIQPVLTAVQIALAETLGAHGCAPAVTAGLSMGEVAAAHVAGAVSLDDALAIVCCQARLTRRRLRPGRMLFARVDAGAARDALVGLEERAAVAVELAPALTVVSGEEQAVGRVAERLAARGAQVGSVPVGFAFHSPEVATLKPEFYADLSHVTPRSGRVPVYSSVTGGEQPPGELGIAHWWRIMSGPAYFARLVQRLLQQGHRTFIEIGPHPLLAEILIETARSMGIQIDVMVPMRRGEELSAWRDTGARLDAMRQRQDMEGGTDERACACGRQGRRE